MAALASFRSSLDYGARYRALLACAERLSAEARADGDDEVLLPRLTPQVRALLRELRDIHGTSVRDRRMPGPLTTVVLTAHVLRAPTRDGLVRATAHIAWDLERFMQHEALRAP